ncbi:MAG: DUF4147 domain-containing protein [Sphaerobacter sp.]|nr:DUF4147 domain-containing protein [Sphaerobacter sp.]
MDLARARTDVTAIFAAALRQVDPEALVRQALALDDDGLLVRGQRHPLARRTRLVVVAIGKASVPMARGALAALGARIDRGVAVTKVLPGDTLPQAVGPIAVVAGSHPVPDEASVAAGQRILATVAGLGPDDVVLALISGGGSALAEVPVSGVSLEDIAQTTDLLLRGGADIGLLNAVRRRLSQIKGGGLAAAIAPARVINLIVSDVLGNPVGVIASGPTVAAPLAMDPAPRLRELGVWERLPGHVRAALTAPVDARLAAAHNVVDTVMLADAAAVADAAAAAAQERGYRPFVLGTRFAGEAREFGGFWATVARQLRRGDGPVRPPACLIGAGELTVTVRGSGRGGRNTEMSLAAALAIDGVAGIAIASLATDGDDGQAGAAGGVVVGDSAARIRAAGLDPAALLAENDSARALAAADGLIPSVSTGTNVNDLYLALLP